MTVLDEPRAVVRPEAASKITPSLLVVLALLSAIAPLATDLYLPAFPAMTVDLATSATTVQLTLTAFLVGTAVGQLVFGPLSDRVGRFHPLLAGTILCLVASAVAAMAPTAEILIAARLVQGLAGSAGMVIGRAIISDLERGPKAAGAFSIMMMVGGIAPILAPFIGSLLVGPIGWRGLLWVVAALALVMLVAVALAVRETHTADRRAANRIEASTSGHRPWAALRSRAFVGNTIAFSFAFAVMMAYISASPFVYQGMIGMTPVAYGAVFGVTALGLLIVSAVSARLVQTRSVPGLVSVGLAVVLAGSLILLALVLIGAPAWTFTIPIFVAVSGLGFILGNATALALAAVPTAVGVASAVLGATQFTLAALVSPLVSLGGEASAVPLAIVMSVSAVIACASFAIARPRRATTGV